MSLASGMGSTEQLGAQVRLLSEALRMERERLTAANERITYWQTKYERERDLYDKLDKSYTTEREVSDKLEKAVKAAYLEGWFDKRTYNDTDVNDPEDEFDESMAHAALTEVAAIRAKQGGEG